jgi:hypothetical protein
MTVPVRAATRAAPDCAWIHGELKRHRHVTLQLLWEEASPCIRCRKCRIADLSLAIILIFMAWGFVQVCLSWPLKTCAKSMVNFLKRHFQQSTHVQAENHLRDRVHYAITRDAIALVDRTGIHMGQACYVRERTDGSASTLTPY